MGGGASNVSDSSAACRAFRLEIQLIMAPPTTKATTIHGLSKRLAARIGDMTGRAYLDLPSGRPVAPGFSRSSLPMLSRMEVSAWTFLRR